MNHHLANTVAMVRAVHFGANPETSASNAFQVTQTDRGAVARATREQLHLAEALENAGVAIQWLEPPRHSTSPDGVFPNNWFSTHEDGTLVFYPMEAASRRTEKIPDIDAVFRQNGFVVNEIIDYSPHAASGEYLEGTGSLVLDRENRIAYACPSSRTDLALAREWARCLEYRMQFFHANDPSGRPVYHTNVVMSVGPGVAVVCLESIPDADERSALCASLEDTGHQILAIRWEQVTQFAGNQLFLQGRDGPVVALSATANAGLEAAQLEIIDRHAQRAVADIATIEKHGGGSVRCMLAEIFLPRE